ncbi:50S ribosomal protein L6 [Candidatus Woesearchaeota archaeon]|nr:50S ribosomal protein L6 [Candidatus Woesearchaeota archaeon]
MRVKDFKETIDIPEGKELIVAGTIISIKGKNGEVSKCFKMPRFIFSKEGNNLKISCKNFNVYDRRNLETVRAHIRNMIKGVDEGYTYLLKICSSHFPMTVAVQGKKLTVKNMLGEKVPRELTLKDGAKVEIKGDIIEVTGADLDIVSQQAADIEQLTRLTNKDRRIFQDGIYITNKDGTVM